MKRYIQMRLANKARGDFRAQGNEIWLYDVIAADEDEAMWLGGVSPGAFIAALGQIDGPVTLRINSPGGSVFGAQAMVAAMRQHPHPITAQIDSLAASAASVIAANCAKCVMVPGSMQMIHRAWTMAVGNCEDLRATADLAEKMDGLIADAYAARAGGEKSRDDFLALMAAETWFTPEEAVAAGIADEIMIDNSQRPKNMWDLSAFGIAADAPTVGDVAAIVDPEPIEPIAAAPTDGATAQRNLRLRLLAKPI